MTEQLKQLMATGDTDEVIRVLTSLSSKVQDKDLEEAIILQASHYKQYVKDKDLGVISEESQRVRISQINQALLNIINQLSERTGNDKEQFLLNSTIAKNSLNRLKWIPALLGIPILIFGVSQMLKNNTLQSSTPTQSDANSITILVHGTGGKDESILPNRGIVQLIYGDANIPEQINNEGEATFKQIPSHFFEPEAKVEILFKDPEGEPYRAVHPDSLYDLKHGQYIGLEVRLVGMEKIHGVVKDFETGQFLENTIIRAQGVDTTTNEFGEFILDIPQDHQKKFITLRAFKEGYENYEIGDLPTTSEQEIVIGMKPK